MRAFNKCLQLGNMAPDADETGSAVWTGKWIKWVVRRVPLHPRLTESQKWAWGVGPACVCLCRTWGLTKPTYFSIGSICYYCSCSAAADVTQLWISIYEGAEDYVLNIFSIYPAAYSANFQGSLQRAIWMLQKLPALPLVVLRVVLPLLLPRLSPLTLGIHPSPTISRNDCGFCFQSYSLCHRKL